MVGRGGLDFRLKLKLALQVAASTLPYILKGFLLGYPV